MKLALSNIAIPRGAETEIYKEMQSLGYTGLEIAPSKLFGEQPYEDLKAVCAFAQELKQSYGFEIPSMQSILFGQHGNLFNKKDAACLIKYTEKAAMFAAAAGCKSMVFGCPKNRVMQKEQTVSDADGFFTEIAALAEKNGTAVALEANVQDYGTNFINTSAQAFEYARKIKHLKINFDFGTVIANDESLNILSENIDLVSHIHISELWLSPIEKREKHKELAKVLKSCGYSGYVSVEMKEARCEKLCEILSYISEVFS